MNVRITGKRPTASWMVAAACLALPPLAHADLDPFALTAGETVTHDSNVLRSPSATAQPDWLSDTRLRLDYNSTFGRSQAVAWASIDASRYRRARQLDNEGHLLGGEFDWATLDHLSGKIGADDNTSLYRAGLSDDKAFEGKSLIHTQRAFTRASLGSSSTPLSIDGGLDFSSAKNSASALAVNNLNQWVGDLGVSYMESPALRISLLGRRTAGKYPDFLPGPLDFHRNDLVLDGNWTPGGFTNVEAQVARTQEDYSVSGGRHYWTGFLRGNWQVTGHISLSASLARDSTQNFEGGVLSQAGNTDTSGGQAGSTGSTGTAGQSGPTGTQSLIAQQSLSMNDALTLGGRWQATSKIDLTGSYVRASRRYNNVTVGSLVLNGSDASRQYLGQIDYQVTRGIRTGCSLSRSTFAPGDLAALGTAFVSNAYSCFAELAIR